MDYAQQGAQAKASYYGVPGNAVPLSTGTGAIGGPIATDRATIRGSLDEQARELAQLHAMLSRLEDILTPVLERQPPEPSTQSAPKDDPVHIVDRLGVHNSIIDLACARIDRLASRLQL